MFYVMYKDIQCSYFWNLHLLQPKIWMRSVPSFLIKCLAIKGSPSFTFCLQTGHVRVVSESEIG